MMESWSKGRGWRLESWSEGRDLEDSLVLRERLRGEAGE